jgi:hypothetical protein
VTPPVPFGARRSAACAALGRGLYLFGGVGARTRTESILDVSNDLWRYDVATRSWEEVARTEPWPAARRCAGFAALGGELVLWGGSGVDPGGYTFLDDLWAFEPGAGWRELAPRGPGPRYWPAFGAVGGALLLAGGYTEDARGKRRLGDTWVLRDAGWRELAGDGPEARYGAASTAGADALALFGGAGEERDLGDAWLLRPDEGWEPLAAGGGPAPRYCAATALAGGGLLVFGGRSRFRPKENHNDLWRLDLATRRWELLQPDREPHRYDGSTPYPGYHAKAATAVLDGGLYLWGGEGRSGHVSDFWRLDLATLAWELLQPARADDPELW